jgi:hypothetical protein
MTAAVSRRTPSREGTQSLEARLAAYALAGGAILAAAEQSQADVIYSGPQSILVGPNADFHLNVNNTGPLADQTTDFIFRHRVEPEDFAGFPATATDLTIHAPVPNQVAGRQELRFPKKGPPFFVFVFQALNAGDPIPGAFDFEGGTQSMAYRLDFGADFGDYGFDSFLADGPFLGASNKFVGLQFEIPGSGTHYGWVRVTVLDDLRLKIHDWAYESTPDQSIVAGAGIPPLPEPGSLAMLALGAAGALALLRHRKQAVPPV